MCNKYVPSKNNEAYFISNWMKKLVLVVRIQVMQSKHEMKLETRRMMEFMQTEHSLAC
jgi:hypothetical protein